MTRLFALALLLTAARDLDVDIPPGSPFDSAKMPVETPRRPPEKPADTTTPGTAPKPATGGGTVAEEPATATPSTSETKKRPPSRFPGQLPGIAAPSTVDWPTHVQWTRDGKRTGAIPTSGAGGGAPVTTGPLKKGSKEGGPAPAAPAPAEPPAWNMKGYPSAVPDAVYQYAITRCLMVLLHPGQVSEAEIIQFLIEMGEPGYDAAVASRADTKSLSDAVTKAVEAPPPAPRRPETEIACKIVMDLLSRTPYEPGFAAWTLSRPVEETLPTLLALIKENKHATVVRNGVFLLRCYDDPEVLPVLRDCLVKSDDKVVRNRALVALVRWKDDAVVEWLCRQLNGPEISFRGFAAWALGRIGAAAAIEPLAAAVKKHSSDGDFLGSAIPALGRLADDATDAVRTRLIKILDGISPPAAIGSSVQNPKLAPTTPDPANIRTKILAERVKIAEARAGLAAREQWMRTIGPDATKGGIQRANEEFFRESYARLSLKK